MARKAAAPRPKKVKQPRPVKVKPVKPARPPKPAHRVPGTSGAVPGVYHLAHPSGAGHDETIAAHLTLSGAPASVSGITLEIVGESAISLGHLLAAWTREQDRLANAAWRRPGGLARMGGL
jgi:hypothetical protein